jgi:hypothetical protein
MVYLFQFALRPWRDDDELRHGEVISVADAVSDAAAVIEPYGNFSPMGVLWYSIGASRRTRCSRASVERSPACCCSSRGRRCRAR